MANPVRVRTAAGWQDLAIVGTQGPVGPTGPQGATGPMGPSGAAVWMTGDTKIGMQPASHADPAGGQWLLADGSAVPGTYTALIAMIGATLPDARGRGLVMLGTHADVNAIGKSDGVGITARRPAHKHSVGTDSPDHSHNVYVEGGGAPITFRPGGGAGNGNVSLMASLGASARHSHTVGPQAGLEPTDNPSYVVVGNLFVHT
jgi:hypothetical protein